MDLKIEHGYKSKGFDTVCGIDEVGRGGLAGPVVAAAVVLSNNPPDGIKDSKKLSDKKRQKLYNEILNNSISVAMGVSSVEEIDYYNIKIASLMAMKRAFDNIAIKIDVVLVDGQDTIPDLKTNQKAIIKGDNSVMSIAAASIVAKVYRDNIMKKYAQIYTNYDWVNNKGYGTKKHLEGIEKYGITPLHRKSFSPIKKVVNPEIY